ncbi:MAG: N-acetylglucosamine-6-phosphate deacetylase [Clostridiaceae bacterium]
MILKDYLLIYPDRIEKGTLRLEQGIIKRINPDQIRPDETVRDGESTLYVSPGFIDLHVHGSGGADVMDGDLQSLRTISRTLCQFGTTSFLAATMTQAPANIRQAVRTIKEHSLALDGARILGIHLEGPFINPEAAGAQSGEHALPPSVEAFRNLTGECADFIRLVTLAPELTGSIPLIRYLASQDITVSIGHTRATYEEALAGIEAGISHATHLFNAMPPFHHRQPGAVGAVFDTPVSFEIIPDGIHVANPVLRTAFKVKGVEHSILVTDAMMACGMPEGEYRLGGQTVTVRDGAARLSDGTLAGSILTMDQAVRHVLSQTDLTLYEVIRMATWNPAQRCGASRNKGRIADGYDADLVIFDEEIRIQEVYIRGRKVC